MGTIKDNGSKKGHFKQEFKAHAGIYKWGIVFFKSIGRMVERKRIANSVTRIKKT